MNRGTLFIISAPSGTGKTTILKNVMAEMAAISFSVSHTTRQPRSGEKNGRDYHFVDRQTFLEMRQKGAFLEWAEVHGNLYGTSKTVVEESLAAGSDIILDIDVQGARQIREAASKAVSIFIAPPSMAELEKRLIGRGTDSTETIALRLHNARAEMADLPLYDYVIINDHIKEASEMFRAIILTERSRNRRTIAGKALPPATLDGSV
ncbi:MAG: guanylate kinase [Proteobacteria bacterium]|nr:guanylate kinase [Pseudomonadota bacterium]MBU1714493.1 guanylate kinase [Pseudomonadota bacterium]